MSRIGSTWKGRGSRELMAAHSKVFRWNTEGVTGRIFVFEMDRVGASLLQSRTPLSGKSDMQERARARARAEHRCTGWPGPEEGHFRLLGGEAGVMQGRQWLG